MPADALGGLVGSDDHDSGVPADVAADAPLEVLVSGEEGLAVGGDGVDVGGGHRGRDAHVQLMCPFQESGHDEAGALLAGGVYQCVEGVDPLAGFGGIAVGQLV